MKKVAQLQDGHTL